jgi:hypothetical protein
MGLGMIAGGGAGPGARPRPICIHGQRIWKCRVEQKPMEDLSFKIRHHDHFSKIPIL